MTIKNTQPLMMWPDTAPAPEAQKEVEPGRNG